VVGFHAPRLPCGGARGWRSLEPRCALLGSFRAVHRLHGHSSPIDRSHACRHRIPGRIVAGARTPWPSDRRQARRRAAGGAWRRFRRSISERSRRAPPQPAGNRAGSQSITSYGQRQQTSVTRSTARAMSGSRRHPAGGSRADGEPAVRFPGSRACVSAAQSSRRASRRGAGGGMET